MKKTASNQQAAEWREGRRLRAFELKQQGWNQREIANALGVTEGAVSQWMKRARERVGWKLSRSERLQVRHLA